METDSTLEAFATPSPPPARMTYEEFFEWHPESGLAEWVDGEAFIMAPPATRHQLVASFLVRCLSFYIEAKALGVILYAPVQMKLERSGREPDILFIATEHLARLDGGLLNGPADLAIEVVSPDSRKRDYVEKFREYAEGGVREYWIIDSTKGQATFYGLGADGTYHALAVTADGVFRSNALTGLWLRVDWLWREPRPQSMSILKEWGLI
jgi:Uma2 family endonuclease